MGLPEYEKILSEFLTPSDIEHGYEMYPDDYKNIAIEYGKQLLDYASENVEMEIEEVYAGSLGNEKGEMYNQVLTINKESITNIKNQLK